MAYYNRQYQLTKTLESLKQYDPKDFNVVIVDDCSTEDVVIQVLPYEVSVIKYREKKYPNSAHIYNTGFNYALLKKPEIILIQNAECYHVGDVLGYAKNVTDENYITFGCFSIDEALTFKENNIDDLLLKNANGVTDIAGATYDGQTGWYNHPIYQPTALHFCSVITTKNLIEINGFDERYCQGIAYEDNYFLQQIKNLGLKVEITEKPFVVHQWHYYKNLIPANKNELMERNRVLHWSLMPNGIRAVHKLTPDLQ
jgi:glycosyltransferase involved in cell wall biosynthesis